MDVDSDLGGRRVDATVEAVAYFVVAEALTNIARHAQATSRPRRRRLSRRRARLRRAPSSTTAPAVRAPLPGSGLAGLTDRVAAVDGTLTVVSPPGRRHDRDRGAPMRVVIAEDFALLREGLARLLAEDGHEVVAAVADAEELVRAVEAEHPDLVVTDVRMPPTHTDEGLRAALVIRASLARRRGAGAVAVRRGDATPPSCSPARPAGSATCSRTGSPT